MITLYGISNCDTVKKAKTWLESQHIDYQFHDYRKDGLDPQLLNYFAEQLGWETLLNKRSTSWRQLNEQQKQQLSETTALQYMLETPTLIKRPLLDTGKRLIIGFKIDDYQQLL